MHDDRRLWIYSGVGVPLGVAVTRPIVYRTISRRGALMIGSDTWLTRSLAQALSRMPLQRSGGLVVDLRPGADTASWASGWLCELLEESPVDHVLAALDPSDEMAASELRQCAARHGAELLWIPPPGTFVPDGIAVPVRASAAEIAAWAGRVIDVIG